MYKWFLCGSLTLTTCQICQNQGCEGIKRWCRLSTPRRATVDDWRCVLTVLCKWSIATQNWLHYVQIVCARPAAGELGEPRHGLILARHLALVWCLHLSGEIGKTVPCAVCAIKLCNYVKLFTSFSVFRGIFPMSLQVVLDKITSLYHSRV